MLNKDYTAKLLNLEDVIITNVENGKTHLFLVLELPFYIVCSNYKDSGAEYQ